MRAFGVMGEWPKDWSRTCGKACVGFLGLCLLTGACGRLAGLQVRYAGPHDARASRNDASVADALVPADTGTYMIQFQKWRCDGTFANNRLGIAWYQAP